MPRSVTELLTCWGGLFRKNANAATWKVISLCLMWSIWKERNACTFE